MLDSLPRLCQLGELIGGSAPRIGGDQVVLEGEQDQFRVIFQVERFHYVILVEHYGFLADLKDASYFLHGATFGK
jgi:hypothetical protein